MLYYTLKILHIISATFVLMSMVYSYTLWCAKNPLMAQRIQLQTWLVIVPFAIMQLLSGFTMMSVQHEDFSQFWIKGTIIGFMIVIGSWFSFIYFLLSSAQATQVRYRQLQAGSLMLCTAALLSMIFFMANKI